MAKRRPGHTPELVPEYEDKVPVANKITFNPHHPELEHTILLPEPRGTEARKMTVRLLPFLRHMKNFMDAEGNIVTTMDNLDVFVDAIEGIWGQENFEEELFPFVLGLDRKNQKDNDIIESITFMGAFQAFIKAFDYLMSGAGSEEFEEAQKKLDGGGEGAEDGVN